jgi:peptide chain release factor 2
MKRCPTAGAGWTLLGGIFDLPRRQSELESIEEETSSPDVWSDPKKAEKLLQKASRLRDIIQPFQALYKRVDDIIEYEELLKLEANAELEAEVLEMFESLQADLDAYELQTLLSGEYDDRSAIIEINAGAGGSEACDWASILFRLYSRWAERRGFKLEILNETPGDVTGYRRMNFQLVGTNAYGYFKSENGVHRLVRISPFDAAARRHTSFAKVEVLPEIDEEEIDIDPDDLRVDTLRAGGAGGQHVNKTESAVRITHIPTGVVVQCQAERSQHKNRASAMRVLVSRLAELQAKQDKERLDSLKGDSGPAEWGRQIRSYVMQPYTMVKDHRTGHETGNVQAVMDGDIDAFIEAFLKQPPDEDAYVE